MAGAKVPLTFRIFKGDQLLREERLSLSVIKLGKVPSAHLKLDDETVSRMHAIIEVNGPGDVSIIDLGSTKGTFVNGQKVNKAKLQSGDTIVVGETKIELAIGTSEEESAPAPMKPPVSQPPADVIASTPRPAASPMAMTMPASAPPPPAAPLSAPAPMAPPRPMAAPMAPPPPAPMMAPMAAPPALRPPPGLGQAQNPFGTAVAAPMGFSAAMAEQVDEMGGARAVEIAAMLGESVVSVKHCVNPRGGAVSGLSIGLFSIGGISLIGMLIAFWMGAHNASVNKEAKDYWTQTLKKPGYSFRETQISILWDVMFWGGLVFALGATPWALARARGERRSPYFRIGTAPGVEFPIEGVPAPAFALVSPVGDDWSFNFAAGMDGEMIVNGQSQSLAELAAQGRHSIAPIPPNAKIRARIGKGTFLVSAAPRPRDFGWGGLAFVNALLVLLVGAVGVSLVEGALVGFMWLLGGDSASSVGLDMAALEDTSTRTSATSQDDPPPPPEEDKPDDGKDESGGTGTAMALDEGKMGKKDSDRAEGQYKMQNNNADPQLARQQAIEQARNAGILGSTALTQGGAFASLTGTGDISSGFDDSNIYGGLLGNEAGEMNGGFGYGRSGFGPGGGGTGWGTIGTGRYGTIGHGSGTGSGYGVGGGRGGMRGRTAAVPTVSIGQPSANGDLDKAIIRRYIKRNIQKITYCYEKQLLAKPGLSGTVSTSFFITPNGTVQNSAGQGVDPEVASCVAGVISGIEFPKPKGGGGVQVNYPFTFHPAGS